MVEKKLPGDQIERGVVLLPLLEVDVKMTRADMLR